ncbi:tyrosine-type recombinase/integrase [uncultured Albimonas sp.]|uniref:tyrosine-type recombinase/integrase n=1 Tax=uncultured Albimonas sp. TaxID=1331701 RepID=UPI0030EC0F64
MMHAVALEILLAVPIRSANLAALDVEKHLTWFGQGNAQTLSLAIPGSTVKNGQPVTADVSRDAARLLRTYLKRWRPMLIGTLNDAVFPMRSGGPRRPGHLSQSLPDVIYRETGLEMNAHLFRHFAGLIFLRRNPGDFETVRRMLGHKKLETTTSFYAELETREALKRWDDVLRGAGR